MLTYQLFSIETLLSFITLIFFRLKVMLSTLYPLEISLKFSFLSYVNLGAEKLLYIKLKFKVYDTRGGFNL